MEHGHHGQPPWRRLDLDLGQAAAFGRVDNLPPARAKLLADRVGAREVALRP
jgi:hypothetical protein